MLLITESVTALNEKQEEEEESKNQTKVEEEGVIRESSDVTGRPLFENKESLTGLEFPPQHQLVI